MQVWQRKSHKLPRQKDFLLIVTNHLKFHTYGNLHVKAAYCLKVWSMGLEKRPKPDRLGPDRRLRLHTFQIDGPRLWDRLQPVGYKVGLKNAFQMSLKS